MVCLLKPIMCPLKCKSIPYIPIFSILERQTINFISFNTHTTKLSLQQQNNALNIQANKNTLFVVKCKLVAYKNLDHLISK